MFFFSSSRWDHFRASLIIMNFNNISSLTNVKCSCFLHENEIGFMAVSDVLFLEMILFENLWWRISTIFYHWGGGECPFSLNRNVSVLEFLWRVCWVSNNIWSARSLLFSFGCQQNGIIWDFASGWWISRIFGHWPTSDIHYPLMKMRSFYEQEFQKCSIVKYTPMFFCSSSKWDHFTISLMMINFNSVVSLTAVWCYLCLEQNEVPWEFLWGSWNATISHHWPTPDVVFLVVKIILFQKFSEQHHQFQQLFIIDQGPMFFYSASKWVDFRIPLSTTISGSIMNFDNISSLTNVSYSLSLHVNWMVLVFFWAPAP